MKKRKQKQEDKTIEINLYMQVEDNAEGQKIIDDLKMLLTELRYNKSYLNGWIGPANEVNR